MLNTIGDFVASPSEPMPIWIFAYLCVGVFAAAALFWAVRRDNSTAAIAWYVFIGLALWPLLVLMFMVAWAFCMYPHKDAFDSESDLDFAPRPRPPKVVRAAVSMIGKAKLVR